MSETTAEAARQIGGVAFMGLAISSNLMVLRATEGIMKQVGKMPQPKQKRRQCKIDLASALMGKPQKRKRRK